MFSVHTKHFKFNNIFFLNTLYFNEKTNWVIYASKKMENFVESMILNGVFNESTNCINIKVSILAFFILTNCIFTWRISPSCTAQWKFSKMKNHWPSWQVFWTKKNIKRNNFTFSILHLKLLQPVLIFSSFSLIIIQRNCFCSINNSLFGVHALESISKIYIHVSVNFLFSVTLKWSTLLYLSSWRFFRCKLPSERKKHRNNVMNQVTKSALNLVTMWLLHAATTFINCVDNIHIHTLFSSSYSHINTCNNQI